MIDANIPTNDILCHKLNSMAEETNDSVTKLTVRLAAVRLKTLSAELSELRSGSATPHADVKRLADFVYSAGETLFVYELIDNKSLDILHDASVVLRVLSEATDAK